jgi:hypothetical protein
MRVGVYIVTPNTTVYSFRNLTFVFMYLMGKANMVILKPRPGAQLASEIPGNSCQNP